MTQENKEISWRAAEHERREYSLEWYLVMFGLAFMLIAIALWQKNFFFTVFIALATLTIFFFTKKNPRILEFMIGENGVKIEKTFHAYETFTHFTLRNRPHALDEIVLYRTSKIREYVRMPIDHELREKARVILKEKLEEKEHEDTFSDILSEIIGI